MSCSVWWVTWDWAPRPSRGKDGGHWRGLSPLSRGLALPGEAVLCVCCQLPVSTPSTVLNSPCREKASWALSFHLCQPPPAPLLNEGHFKCCFSLIPSQLLWLQGHAPFSAVLVHPTSAAPLSPQQVGGASCVFRTAASSVWPNYSCPPNGMEFPPAPPCPCVGRRISWRAPALAGAYQRLVTVSKGTGIAF